MKRFCYFRELLRVKKALSILLIVVFFLAQYGKVVSYMYCKWKAEVKAVTCDCEKKLGEDTKAADHSAQLLLKDKSEDPCITADLLYAGRPSEQINSCFVNTVSTLSQGFESSLLHPPAHV